ncbi:hypothetical protein [Cellulomonas palmilytica]|uniref:hypothetical protein n=1 Tax=Cellulomonas palmilytica TaxID=2608402 RepID=UPI001F1BDD7A|nr:hypothetical protein [Cellulomonas palmilytica]UJP40549.1 hypothetical protein F1D97_03280 [Cellulomonas palmilytica]
MTALLDDGELRPLSVTPVSDLAVGDHFVAVGDGADLYLVWFDEPRVTRLRAPGVEAATPFVADATHVGWRATLRDGGGRVNVRYDLTTNTLRTTDSTVVWATGTGALPSTADSPEPWTIVEWAD